MVEEYDDSSLDLTTTNVPVAKPFELPAATELHNIYSWLYAVKEHVPDLIKEHEMVIQKGEENRHLNIGVVEEAMGIATESDTMRHDNLHDYLELFLWFWMIFTLVIMIYQCYKRQTRPWHYQ